MKRAIGVVVLAAALVTAGTSNAFARGPKWEFVPSGSFELPAELCGFPVGVTTVVDKEYAKTVSETATTLVLRVTGALVVRFENLDTGTATTVNISGPGTERFDFAAGTASIDGQGNWVLFFGAADQQQFGVPGIALFSSHFHETLDLATNDALSLSWVGHLEDLCAQIA
jgi:hypothetical protein